MRKLLNLSKGIKDLNKRRDVHAHKTGLSVKMSVLFNVIYKFNTTPVKT